MSCLLKILADDIKKATHVETYKSQDTKILAHDASLQSQLLIPLLGFLFICGVCDQQAGGYSHFHELWGSQLARGGG